MVIASGDVLDLAAAGSSLRDHAVAVVGDRIAEVGSRVEMIERWDVRTVLVNGAVVVDEGVVTTIDTPAALAEATATLRSIAR